MGKQVKEDGLRKVGGGEEDSGQKRRGSEGGLRREREREWKGIRDKGKREDRNDSWWKW